jgi:hypothetical protein
MKSNNSTLQLSGKFLKSVTNRSKSCHFTRLLTPFFLFISLVSFAGTESMRINLYLLNANNTTILADGVLTEYNNLYHDSVTLEDAYKFTNINENLGLTRYGCVLAVERRPIISAADTVFLKLWKTTSRDYQFEFVSISLNHPGMQAFLEDAYLGTSTALSLSGATKINFSVNADAASAGLNRFRIVYQESYTASPLPVTFTSVKGYRLSSKIAIDWKVENEINIAKYEVERSENGTDFIKVNTIATRQNNAYSSYSWVDDNPVSGNNFYRIKSVDRNGSGKFSSIVKVATGKTSAGTITIFPNPIKGNMVNLRFTNQPTGIYQVRLINNSGQVVYSGRLPVNSSNISQALFTDKKLAGGIYQLEIKAPDNTVNIQQAIVQE